MSVLRKEQRRFSKKELFAPIFVVSEQRLLVPTAFDQRINDQKKIRKNKSQRNALKANPEFSSLSAGYGEMRSRKLMMKDARLVAICSCVAASVIFVGFYAAGFVFAACVTSLCVLASLAASAYFDGRVDACRSKERELQARLVSQYGVDL